MNEDLTAASIIIPNPVFLNSFKNVAAYQDDEAEVDGLLDGDHRVEVLEKLSRRFAVLPDQHDAALQLHVVGLNKVVEVTSDMPGKN